MSRYANTLVSFFKIGSLRYSIVILFSLLLIILSIRSKAEVHGLPPVEIISFNCFLNEGRIDLDWFVASENEFSHYIIQKSSDNKNYNDIGIVFGKGPDQKFSYKFNDLITQKGILFYRLKAVDKSGKSKFSPISIVKVNESPTSVTTFPNPFADQINITVPDKWQNKTIRFEIFNHVGRRMIQSVVIRSAQTERLNLNSLGKGMYILKAINENESYQQVIIKN